MKALALVLAVLAAAPAAAEGVDGLWRTERQPSGAYIQIRIGPCDGEPDQRCGVIEGAYAGARRDIVGDEILRGMKRRGPDMWAEGEIIRPGQGTVYSSMMRLTDDGALEVKGCLVGGFFCGGQTWARVP
ncbi:MAG: DUF2147 domain-containing protein [Pseudomonadota bacterium]